MTKENDKMNNFPGKSELTKRELFDLYEKLKKDKVDLIEMPTETFENMCILLEEEIKIKERYIKELKNKLSNL